MTTFNDKVTELVSAVYMAVKARREYEKEYGKEAAADRFKQTWADRDFRKQKIDALIEAEFERICKMPESKQLERLADALLNEELTDDTAWKSRQNEYPFLSEQQLARRREGVHQRKNEGGQREVGLKKAWSVGTDGRDMRKPTRRERSDNENIHLDNATLSRNKARRKAYLEFIAVQPVHTYHISELEGE